MSTVAIKIPVTVIVLAHQPDHLLKSCLESIQWATEKLLVATQESPEWQQIAKQYQALLVQYPGEVTDFSRVRNWAMTIASEEWVFFVDSDEVVTKSSVTEIQRVIASSVDGVTVTRKDIFRNNELNWGEAGRTKLLRLARKKRFSFDRPVHEVGTVDGKVVDSQIVIKHYAHASVAAFMNSVVRYAEMEATYRVRNGTRFSLVRLLIFPPGKAVFNLVIKLGLLDGFSGFVYAVMMSLHSVLVSVFIYEKQKQI